MQTIFDLGKTVAMKAFRPLILLLLCFVLDMTVLVVSEQFISSAFFNRFQLITAGTTELRAAVRCPEYPPWKTLRGISAPVPVFATILSRNVSVASSIHDGTLLRHLDTGDADWQTILIVTVRNFSHVFDTLERLTWGNPHWIYLIVFPSFDTQESRLKFRKELKSKNGDRFGSGLSIANKVFVLFPQESNGMVELSMYPVEGVSIYMLKNRLFLHNHKFDHPITSDDIMEETRLRTDFDQLLFTVVTVRRIGAWEYNTTVATNEKEAKYANGYLTAKAITYIAEALNFRVEAVTTDTFVGRDEYGNLTGMGAMVVSGQADISVSASELLVWRKEHLSFMQPTFTSRIRGYMIIPPRSVSGNVFYLAFQFSTWKSLIGTTIGLGIFVASYAKLKKLATNNSSTRTQNAADEEIAEEALLWATGAMCQQGWHISPESMSLRIIFIMGYVVGLICFIGYSATLVSMISTPKQPTKNLKEWNEIGWKIIADMSTKALTTVEEDTGLGFLWNLSADTALESVMAGKSIYLSVNEVFNPIVRNYFREHGISTHGKRDGCNVDGDRAICLMIYDFPIHWSTVKASMFVKKQSPLTGFLQQKTILLLQSGIQKRNYLQFFKQDAFYCAESDEADLRRPMEIQDVYTTFIVLFIGGALSLSCLLGEWLFAKHFKDYNNLGIPMCKPCHQLVSST